MIKYLFILLVFILSQFVNRKPIYVNQKLKIKKGGQSMPAFRLIEETYPHCFQRLSLLVLG